MSTHDTTLQQRNRMHALLEAYVQARSDGLCAAGAWEIARQSLPPAELAGLLQHFPFLPEVLGELSEAPENADLLLAALQID